MCLLLNVNIPCKKQEQNFCPFSDMTLVANTRNLQFISTEVMEVLKTKGLLNNIGVQVVIAMLAVPQSVQQWVTMRHYLLHWVRFLLI